MCAEGAVTGRMCQNRFAKFHAGVPRGGRRPAVGGAPRWAVPRGGRCPAVGGAPRWVADQTQMRTKNHQQGTTRVITDTLEISTSVRLLVKRQNKMSFILQEKPYEISGQLSTK